MLFFQYVFNLVIISNKTNAVISAEKYSNVIYFRWFEVNYRLTVQKVLRGCKASPKEARSTFCCVIVVLACRSFWNPYPSLFKEIMLCILLTMIGIWVFILSPASFRHNFKGLRSASVDGMKI